MKKLKFESSIKIGSDISIVSNSLKSSTSLEKATVYINDISYDYSRLMNILPYFIDIAIKCNTYFIMNRDPNNIYMKNKWSLSYKDFPVFGDETERHYLYNENNLPLERRDYLLDYIKKYNTLTKMSQCLNKNISYLKSIDKEILFLKIP